ncbi:MAG: efflux transporter outer membrane subunit [Planctomycetota bacterium]
MRAITNVFVVATVCVVVGCQAVGPDYEPPEAKLPTEWRENVSPEQLPPREAELAAWWRVFADPILSDLVERASEQSLDLREALARVQESRALRGVARGDRYPTINGDASYRRRDDSDNSPLGFVSDVDLYTAGLDASWEVDLWGRVRRSVEAADADLDVSIENARDVLVTVAAETAMSYIELRAFQRRIEIARTNVMLQEQTSALVRSRLESGLVGERDAAQAITNVETTRARVPTLEIGLRAAENRLAVLLGLAPGALAADVAAPLPIPVPPVEAAVGLPADLLRRRADVRGAERELAAATARVGVAQGDLYPRLSLFGNLGVEADSFPDLFERASATYGFGPSIRWNLFDGGKLRRRVEAQGARVEQALVRWERAVLMACEETENAMTSFVREQERRRSLVEAANQSRRAAELARTQYREGLSDFQIVLDSERARAVIEDELAQSDAAIAMNLVVLYKALGGGWEQSAL